MDPPAALHVGEVERRREEERRRIAMAVHEALSQRVVVRHHMTGLSRDELGPYLAHLLRLAGNELPLFEPSALEAIHHATSGLPRKVNLLAHHALTAAALARKQDVGAEHVQAGDPGDNVTACGVWLTPRGLVAVLVDDAGRARACSVAPTDDARSGLALWLAAAGADLVVDEMLLEADPIADVARRAGVTV